MDRGAPAATPAGRSQEVAGGSRPSGTWLALVRFLFGAGSPRSHFFEGVHQMRSPKAGILVLLSFQLCSCGGEQVGLPGDDHTAPAVSSTTPGSGDAAVALNATVAVTFSEPMDASTLSTATFTLFDGTKAVAGTVTVVGVTALLTPTVGLNPDTLYGATIAAGVKDPAGNPMGLEYAWSFTTGTTVDRVAPQVSATTPADGSKAVASNAPVTATFSEPMDPSTLTPGAFTLLAGTTPVPGTVSCVGVTATFQPTGPLAANTLFAPAITTAVRDLAGNALAQDFHWTFTTGALQDTTRPTVSSTLPADQAIDVVLDDNVSATFSEGMDPLTLTTETFTLRDAKGPIAGTVAGLGATVIFDPAGNLDPETKYTATLTRQATDLAGNAMTTDFVWNFTTGSTLDPGAPDVVLTNPADLATAVPVDSTVNATFSEAMDPLTITTATFKVTRPGPQEITGTVLYDGLSRIGSFTPENGLLPNTTYTATITTGARDLPGKAMGQDHAWSFTTGAIAARQVRVDLGTLNTFVAVAGAGLTNSNSAGVTTLNGDVGLSPTGLCLGDGSPCTLTNPVINGTLYVNDPEGVAAHAKVDLTAAYVDAMARPVGTMVNDVSAMILPPGVYTSDSTMSIAVGGVVTLDGKGDANAVWIFQVGSSLTVNNSAQVLLINGARARNVFWAAFASSTLGSNVSFQGSILAGASNSVGTNSTVVGRLLCTTGEITLLSDTITLPPI